MALARHGAQRSPPSLLRAASGLHLPAKTFPATPVSAPAPPALHSLAGRVGRACGCYSGGMLRRVRWLLLAAMAAVAALVAWVYWQGRLERIARRPELPAPLPRNTAAVASQWEYEIKSGEQSRILVRAREFEQVKEPPVIHLRGLEVEIRQADGPRYDLVRSPEGTFRQTEGTLTAEGEVEITLGLRRGEGGPPPKVMTIRTSAVSLDVQTNRAWTERPAEFESGRARGWCVGASYDPASREIVMESAAELEWSSENGARPPLRVSASKIIYREATADVILMAPSRLVRGGFELRGQDAFVKLNDEGLIEHVQTAQAAGSDRAAGRALDFEAGELMVRFGPDAEVRKIEASRRARIVSVTAGGVTEVTADRVGLDFEPGKEGAELRHALAMGQGRVESRPAARRGAPPPPVRVLTSEVIHLAMRAGGREMERVWTEAPGRVEFRPGAPDNPFRSIAGERMTFDYAAENRLEHFRAARAETLTVKPGKDKKPVETRTRSDDLEARFDPASGELEWLRQWNGFSYEEGPRRATAAEARLEARTDRIELKGDARVRDDNGLTAAPLIRIDQKQDVTTAEGGVSAVMRAQERPGGGGLLGGPEPLRATAERMTVREQNRKILFEGNAVLWQGGTRLRAQKVRIDREEERLEAEGSVVAEIPDERGGARGAAARRTSVVHAPSLVYEGREKRAVFAGGARLERPGMTVESRELRAFFAEEKRQDGVETRLERLEADGSVVIREAAAARRRTGRGEHAVYFLAEERMVLSGGSPSVEDEQRGITRGAVITWFGRQDRVIVDNEGAGPAVSRVKQKGS